MEYNILLLHFLLCSFMTGLIWLIQLVHYPSFRYVEASQFTKFEDFHARTISYIVMPAMLFELFSAIILFVFESNNIYLINLILDVLIFISTFLLSAPFHKELSISKDPKAIDKLILFNWPRTILWTLRTIILYITLAK